MRLMKTMFRFVLALVVATICSATVTRLEASPPKFTVTGIKIIAPDGSQTNAVAGSPFFVQVDYTYANSVKTNYTIARVVNGWTNFSAPTNYGYGYTGTTSWAFNAGEWLMYKAGTYSITVTVDPENVITPASNTGKTMTTNLGVQASFCKFISIQSVEWSRA